MAPIAKGGGTTMSRRGPCRECTRAVPLSTCRLAVEASTGPRTRIPTPSRIALAGVMSPPPVFFVALPRLLPLLITLLSAGPSQTAQQVNGASAPTAGDPSATRWTQTTWAGPIVAAGLAGAHHPLEEIQRQQPVTTIAGSRSGRAPSSGGLGEPERRARHLSQDKKLEGASPPLIQLQLNDNSPLEDLDADDYEIAMNHLSVESARRRSTLVRQLSALLMNNGYETIKRKLAGTQVRPDSRAEASVQRPSGSQGSSSAGELKLAGRGWQRGRRQSSPGEEGALSSTTPSVEDNALATIESGGALSHWPEVPGGGGTSESPGSPGSSDLPDQPDQPDQPGLPDLPELPGERAQSSVSGGQVQAAELATCSPDYDDTISVESGTGGALESATLSAEQRQQLQSRVEEHGLLASGVLPADGTGQPAAPPPLMPSCVQAGSRMIELITKIITPILFSIIIVVGLLGNIIVMLVILEDRKLERELTPTNLLILDLSLADLSFIIFCIPFTGWDYAVGHWVFGLSWCKFNQYLIVVCALSSIYTLVLMSCDRFAAIVYPIESIKYRTSRNMLHAIVIKWIVILLIASPTILVHGLVDSPLGPQQYNCRFLSDQHNPLHFQIIFFITSYLFPLILIFCLYLSLLNKLWFGAKPLGHKESHKMLESKKKVTWLVASIVIVFAACWFPIQIMLILMRLKSYRITATYVAVQVIAHTLGYMNSCVNPIVYAFASETFNQSFKKSRLGHLCCWWRGPSFMSNGSGNGNGNGHGNGNGAARRNSERTMADHTHAHHLYNNPTSELEALTRAASHSVGSASDCKRHSSNSFVFDSARNSLQAGVGFARHRGEAAARPFEAHGNSVSLAISGNRSLNGTAARVSASSRPQLKLEPRDRPQAMVAAAIATSNISSPSALLSTPTTSYTNNTNAPTADAHPQHFEPSKTSRTSSLTTTTTTTTTTTISTTASSNDSVMCHSLHKQQLVARMTTGMSSQSNQVVVVAHQLSEPHSESATNGHHLQDNRRPADQLVAHSDRATT